MPPRCERSWRRSAHVRKFDFGPKCKDCIELNPVWHALARETPGTLWRVDCLDSPDVCKERMVSAAVDDLEAAEPVFKSFNGTRWRRLARKATPQTLKEYVKAKGSAARVFNPGRRGGDSAWDAPPEEKRPQQPAGQLRRGSGGARARAPRRRCRRGASGRGGSAPRRSSGTSCGGRARAPSCSRTASSSSSPPASSSSSSSSSSCGPSSRRSPQAHPVGVGRARARAAASVARARAPGRLWSERRRASEAKLAEARAAKVASQLIAEEQVCAPAS